MGRGERRDVLLHKVLDSGLQLGLVFRRVIAFTGDEADFGIASRLSVSDLGWGRSPCNRRTSEQSSGWKRGNEAA
jgi:hypothetical protein